VTGHSAVSTRLKIAQTVVRVCLIVAALSWWGLVVNICWAMPQPDGLGGRMILFNCPSGIAFITRAERVWLYGLVPGCLAFVAADIVLRAVSRRD
jgi:hypothetical protein